MTQARQLPGLLVLAIGLVCTTASMAAQVAPHILHEIPDARLYGKGSYRWLGLKLYEARLWASAQGYRPEAPWSAPYALELVYARKLAGTTIADASAEEIARLGFGTLQQRAGWRARMRELFPDVEEGSSLTGVFTPGRGPRFYLDGAFLQESGDEDFARAFFGIWLDPGTSAPQLRKDLLRATP
jgi:hypothetical protein